MTTEAHLQVYRGEVLVFSSNGNWLHPLFELEDFLADSGRDAEDLLLRDKLIGRGAAVLIARMGFRTCHGAVVSRRALPVLDDHGITCTRDELVDRLDCATETALTDDMSLESAYAEIARRAGRSAAPAAS